MAVEILVPIFICVILPVSIVLIISLTKINGENKKTQIILKAIETNKDVDTDKLVESLRKPLRTPRELLNIRLLRGCMYSLIGLALIIVGLVNLAGESELGDDPVTIPLVFGGIVIAIGISYLIVYYVTRKQIDTIESEEK